MSFGSQWVRISFAFVLGIALTTGIMSLAQGDRPKDVLPLRQSDVNPENTYEFIDPLLGINNPNEKASPEFAPLETSLRSYIEKEKAAGRLEAASVKVRDLQRSTGITINPEEKYAPASLLKVPTMMTLFKLAEDDASLMGTSISYARGQDQHMPFFGPTKVLEEGERYTIRQLIERMIRYSDNEATILLERHLDRIGKPQAYETLTQDLGIEDVHIAHDFITIQSYGLFWRVLYNATYLNRESSEEALRLLSTTDFGGGIKMGVPSGTQVAHKFGEYGLVEPGTGKVLKAELHDCGIVYVPQTPYFLCVMTKGKNMDTLDLIIREISRITYKYRSP